MASTKKNAKIKVSFKGVEGKRALLDEGEHLSTVVEVTKEKGPKADYLKWKFEADDDAGIAYTNTSLSKESLWNLRGLLEALGVEVDEEDAMELDLTEFPDMRCGIVISHEDYEGKPQARIVDYFSEDEAEEKGGKKKKKGKNDESDKKGKKSKKDKKKSKKISKSDVEDKDRDELSEMNDEHDLELDMDDFKDNKGGLKKLLAAVLEKLDENDLLEDDAGDGEKLVRSEVEDMDSDALADVIKDQELDVDLNDHSTLRKQVKAVIKALEEADKLED